MNDNSDIQNETLEAIKELGSKTEAAINKLEDKTDDILTAVNDFADKTERRFEKLEEQVSMVGMEQVKMRSEMVTKNYLDDKLADLRGDLVVLTRKEDGKLRLLVEKLHQRQILSDEDKQEIFKMEPFPQLYT